MGGCWEGVKDMWIFWRISKLLFVLFLISCTGSTPGESGFGLTEGKVLWVYDGDTALIRVRGREERVRLIGLNCPELEEPWGKDAYSYTRRILGRRRVYLERDIEERDSYGRLLSYVWLDIPKDRSEAEIRGKMLNAMLIVSGYARKLDVPPNLRYSDLFSKLQMEAMKAGRGVWMPNGKERYYVGNKRSRKFHIPSCQYGQMISPRNRVIFKSREEAIKSGYVPCRFCNP
jgi:micrococcal nuclease